MLPALPAPSLELTGVLKAAFTEIPEEWRDRFGGYFRGLYGEGLHAVLLYGSYLSPSLRKPTSFPDFILVTKGRRQASRTWGQKILYPFLPPHALSGSVPATEGAAPCPPGRPGGEAIEGGVPAPDGSRLACKYYVMAAEDFEVATGYKARDLSIAGRLSKRIAILYDSEGTGLDSLICACARSMTLNAALALPSFGGPFQLDEFCTAALNVSYLAEFRMTEAGKVKGIFNAEAEFYRRAYAIILRQLCDSGLVRFDGGRWTATAESAPFLSLSEELIRRSRRNGKWRLAKYILLFRGWTRYLVDKIERSQGERIGLTPLQKRLPLLFAWGHFFRLLRQGRLK